MGVLSQDLRYGFRVMRKSPGFVLIAVLALALGTGANTAIFSLVNALLLRPISYENPDRLAMVWEKSVKRGFGQIPTSLLNFTDLRTDNKSFEDLGAFTDSSFNLTGAAEPEKVTGVRVTASLLSLLGRQPLKGRLFLAGEDQPQASHVLILSHHLWQRSFGSNANLVGQTVALNGESYTVVGIMPPDFKFPPTFSATVASSQFTMPHADLWVPLTTEAVPQVREGRTLYMTGRLKPGVTATAAQAEMNVIASRLQKEYPAVDADMEVDVIPLREQVTGDIRPALLVLFGAVGCVLLIACANVANLLLAKASGRQKEVAVRIALGATRLRIIQQLLTESMLLSLAGGILGSIIGVMAVRQLIAFTPSNVPKPDIGIDAPVLLFTLLLSVFTSFIFGLVPALQASKSDLNETLKEGGRGNSGGVKQNRVRSLLVIAEVALALVLLIGAGLMIKSFVRLQNVNPGFNPENLITLELQLPQNKYGEKDRQAAFQQQVVERLAEIPGVESAGAVNYLPFSGTEFNSGVTIEGRPPVANANERPRAFFRNISPNYFQAMGIPVRQGRPFADSDNKDAPAVVIINEAAARRFYPNEDPLGKRFKQGRAESKNPWVTVVGIVGGVSHTALGVASQPEVYLPFQQNPDATITLLARTKSDPRSLAATVRREVAMLDKDLPVSNIKFMDEIVAGSVSQPRAYALLLGIFAGLALVLAAIGIYGVISYSVTQRTHEVGIRMALGAQTKDVLALIIKQGMALALVGIFLGLIVSLALTRVLASQLYGVSSTDPVTFSGISLLLVFVAVIACYIPALRATKVDPMIAVRYE